LWDPWRRNIDDYYACVSCHDEAMGLWAWHYVQSKKMIKKEKMCKRKTTKTIILVPKQTNVKEKIMDHRFALL